MNNNSKKTNDATETKVSQEQTTADTEHQQWMKFIRSMDDYGTAVEIRLAKTERAKELLAQIFMVTSGVCVVPDDNEFAHKNLLEIFEMFLINHKNFSTSTLAEELQRYIFVYTQSHDNAYSEWRDNAFAEQGLDANGNELKTEIAEPQEDSDTQRQTATQTAEPETKTDKVLTVEERIIVDRRAVALWLHNAGNHGTPAIKNIVGELLTEIEGDTQALNTPAHIENILLEYEKMIAENPDDERALNAADKLLDLAKDVIATDSETSMQMINVADSLQNPNGEAFLSELSGRNLASTISELLENPNLPKTFEKFLYIGLNDIYNNCPLEIQQRLGAAEDFSTEYLTELFKYDKEKIEPETEQKEVLDLSEMCGDFLRTNEATAGEKPIPLAVLLSAAMKHPDMPTQIYNVLSDEFSDVPEGFHEQPETIQATLDNLSQKQKKAKK